MADPSNQSATVLIVEDERNLADLYAEWLGDAYSVKTVYDGEEALDLLDETVDVVLLDRRMPGLSVDEVLDIIHDRSLATRVAIVSAVTPDFDIIEMGFDAYAVKPVSKEQLHDVADTMLTRAAYDTQIRELYRLIETKSALEAEKSSGELVSSEAYDDLENRLATLRDEIETTLDEYGEPDFEAEFRPLSPSAESNSDDHRSSSRGRPSRRGSRSSRRPRGQ